MTKAEIRSWLKSESEEGYKRFSSSLIPGGEPMYGIRIPILRKKAKEIVKDDWREFLSEYGIGTEGQPDSSDCFEENQLLAMVLGYCKAASLQEAEELLNFSAQFIPRIQNWSVNDTFCQGFVLARKYPGPVWNFLMQYRDSINEFEQRVVAVTLMSHFLTDDYIDRVLEVLTSLHHDGYYVKMGVAWALATAYAKYPEKTLPLFQTGELDSDVWKKSIQKMLESYRVSDADKQMLREMRKKRNDV